MPTPDEVDAFVAQLESETSEREIEEEFDRGLPPGTIELVDFCQDWPCAKRVLELIRNRMLEGRNWKAVTRWAVNRIIRWGDRHREKHCVKV